jgi:homoserine kinase
MRITVRVPATSANLGPGFDCFGLALDLCNEVVLDTDAEPGVTWEGEGADELPTDGSDMVSRAIDHALAQRRRFHPGADLPSFSMHGINRIPLERGLGSSASAAVAGVAAAGVLLGDTGWEDRSQTMYTYASELEGHPDNAAPASYGGFTIVADEVHRFEPHPELRLAVLIPRTRLPTIDARRALPSDVSLGVAVFNIARAGLLTAAITRDPGLLGEALDDRVHQGVRLALVPDVREVFEELHRNMPICVSGAGPSLLAFETNDRRVPDLPESWHVLRVSARSRGCDVFVED